MDRLLKVTEVAALWGVDKQTVYRALWAKDLPFVDLAAPGAKKARIRIRTSAAEAYIAQRESAAAA
ncbi:DNA binding domain-containing protein, excisionase family [Micromonospora nigra]|uniref:DNA binding domain-containing protein, excisionase family n=1 Tax=Micromonospora nigra TaxID=145857 RepID=A0A1C6SRW7_9ACTN|nr:helix-turn-helix domain-containing protein [Micromonospora nigra]SCL32217.1 DNA binding domain-containing protein, excisionase family [Micromonospora nigra]